MINIALEGGGYQRVKSWEDIRSLPNYADNVQVDPSQFKLVIGNYDLDDAGLCGLTVCRQPHGRGYLVQLADGRKINLGKDCGKKYFGTEFQFAQRKFDNDLRDQNNRESLTAAKHQLAHHRERVTRMCQGQHGANWIHKLTSQLTTRAYGVPDQVVTELYKLTKTRSGLVTKDRMATKEELDRMEGHAVGDRRISRQVVVQEPVGVIEGLAALYKENDLRQLLTLDISSTLDEVKGADVATMRSRDLGSLNKKVSEIDGKFTRAEQAISEGRKLLRRRNLAILDFRITDNRDRQKYTDFLKALPE
jgi:hypothetical protein